MSGISSVMSGFTISDVLIILATIIGPVVAVQAQKWIERSRERSNRRENVFHTLMATRATALSQDHVRALNSVPLAYQGSDTATTKVRNAWRSYIHNLSVDVRGYDENQLTVHYAKRGDLFVDLLAAMADERKFTYDRVALATEAYHPHGAGMAEYEQELVRKLLLAVLEGKSSLRILVVNQSDEGTVA